jgi:hypothetical protein
VGCGVHASLALLTGRVACWPWPAARIGVRAKNARTTWNRRGTHPWPRGWSLPADNTTPLQACQPATLLPKLGSCRRETAPIISCPAHRAVSLLYVVRPARCQPATQTSQSACMTLSNWSKSAGSLSGIADASNPTFQHPRPGDEREYLCQPSQPSDAYLATSQQGRVVWARR